jgi:transposase
LHLFASESGIESVCLSPGNHGDSSYFKALHDHIDNPHIKYIIADKGYDSNDIRECIESFGQTPVIPYRRNRLTKKDINYTVYKTRNIIERLFGRIKEYRRVATRYDKLDTTFMSFIICAFIAQIIC